MTHSVSEPQSARLSVALDGYTDLPPGTIATIVTYLSRPAANVSAADSPGSDNPAGTAPFDLIGGDVARYRALYRRIGDRWLWFSRLTLPDATLRQVLEDPDVEALALRDGGDIGLLELDFRQRDCCEIAMLGVVPEAVGRRAGQALMAEAIRRAGLRGVARLVVHTCTLDHPSALAFYLRSGFRPDKRAIEITRDPRLAGLLPRDAAPHHPVIEGAP